MFDLFGHFLLLLTTVFQQSLIFALHLFLFLFSDQYPLLFQRQLLMFLKCLVVDLQSVLIDVTFQDAEQVVDLSTDLVINPSDVLVKLVLNLDVH